MNIHSTCFCVGDWVKSYTPGIWQVFRVIQNEPRLRYSLNERKRGNRRPVIFCKRLVDECWKASFTGEICDPAVVQVLSSVDRARLDDFLSKNPDILDKFSVYEPRDLDSAMDLLLIVPDSIGKNGIQSIANEVFADIEEEGLSNDEILERIDTSQLRDYVSPRVINAILRFLCKEHEIRDGEYVFRKVQVIMV